MPQASEQTASGPLFGEIEAIWGSNKPPKPVYIDPELRQLTRELTGDVSSLRGQLPGYIEAYQNTLGRLAPQIHRATVQSDRALRNILQRRSDPMSEFRSLGDYLFDKATAVPDRVIDYYGNMGRVSDLARGIDSGRAGSTYETLTRGRMAEQAALNAQRAALSAIGQNYPNLQNAILARDTQTMNILPLRRAGYEALANRSLLPYQALSAGIGDLQRLAMGQTGINRANLQGFQPRENWANRLGAAGRATTANINQIMDWAQQAASIYGSVMGGGALGGMMGGGGGGGGTPSSNPFGSAQAQTAMTAQTQGPAILGGYQPAYIPNNVGPAQDWNTYTPAWNTYQPPAYGGGYGQPSLGGWTPG